MSIAEPVGTDLILPRKKMTIDEFLLLPDDEVDRMLIDGEVWEMGVSLRGHLHGEVAANIAHWLVGWNKAQSRPRGKVSVGDAGFRLVRGDGSVLGPDVAYASAEVVLRTLTDEMAFYDGSPTLAVEVLSRSDTFEAIITKIRKYLQVGTVVWEVDPEFQHIRVHRPGLPIESYNTTQELVGDPYLPGFRVAVAEFFAD